MTHNMLFLRSSTILAAGGLAWLAKLAVIAASDGAEAGTAEAIASVLYLLGVVLMAIGLAGVAIALSAGRHVALRALCGAAGLVSFFVTFVALESVAKSLAGDSGPAWFHDEVGILATGAVLTAIGLLGAQRATGSRTALMR